MPSRDPSIHMFTVRQVIEKINDVYFLPDIQREYCWDEKRVLDLFDSILNGYPLGTCLIWKQHIDTYNNAEYNFYRFINKVELMANTGGKVDRPITKGRGKNLFAVLDGQQRLTSLYLAITGGFAVWKGRGRRPKKDPPLRELYFKPASRNTKTEVFENEFAFYDKEGANNNSGWYRVKDIYKAKSSDAFCISAGITKKPEKTQVSVLFDKLNKTPVLSFYEITAKFTVDDAVNIFMRMNSGGVPLKRTELLFALAINHWPGGRAELEDYLKEIHTHPQVYGSWESVDKDFLLKTCLYLFEKKISLAVDNLSKVNFEKISNNWKMITESISDVLKFLDERGHCSASIKSDNAIIPIIYYRFFNVSWFREKDVKHDLNTFFIISQINGLFGSSTDTVLTNLKSVMIQFNGRQFVFNEYAELFGNRIGDKDALKCDPTTISSWIYGSENKDALKKGDDTRLLLASLPEYHDRKNYFYEQDHLHPVKSFNDEGRNNLIEKGITSKMIDEWAESKDTIGNLQLYRGRSNRNKSGKPLEVWKKSNTQWSFAYDPAKEIRMDKQFDSEDSPYSIKYYGLFIQYRSEMIFNALKELLLEYKDEADDAVNSGIEGNIVSV